MCELSGAFGQVVDFTKAASAGGKNALSVAPKQSRICQFYEYRHQIGGADAVDRRKIMTCTRILNPGKHPNKRGLADVLSHRRDVR